MNEQVAGVARECGRLSMAGAIDFPEVVRRLGAAGVERYRADLAAMGKRYYTADGQACDEPLPLPDPPPVADAFSGPAVVEALRAVQGRAIDYPEFLRRVMRAGVVAYEVYLSGRRAIYLGRRGEFHVETFPGGK